VIRVTTPRPPYKLRAHAVRYTMTMTLPNFEPIPSICASYPEAEQLRFQARKVWPDAAFEITKTDTDQED
jgi:hypothetical protein